MFNENPMRISDTYFIAAEGEKTFLVCLFSHLCKSPDRLAKMTLLCLIKNKKKKKKKTTGPKNHTAGLFNFLN